MVIIAIILILAFLYVIITFFIIIDILISIIRNKVRIKEKKLKYYIQCHGILFWYDCDKVFYSKEEAMKNIK